jgi:hypothetical protein
MARKFNEPFSTEDYAWCIVNNRTDLVPDELHESCTELSGCSVSDANRILEGTSQWGSDSKDRKSAAPPKETAKEPAMSGTLDVDGKVREQEPDEYDEWTVEELKEELSDRMLPTGGKKQELIDRLRVDDKKE